MIVHVYSIMRDEEDLVPYFLRHYSTFADTIFILDDHSTDKTVEIAKAHRKVRLLDFNYKGGLDEAEHSACFEESYKKYSRGRADWVICVDADEFIYHEDIVEVLEAQRKAGRKVIKATGYNMYAEVFPTTTGQIYEECYMGQRTTLYDKKIIFDPALDVKLEMGRHHTTLPEGIDYYRAKILLLHYRYLSKDFILERFSRPPPGGMSERKWAWKLTVALKRHEQAIKGGSEFIKVL